MDTKFFLMGKIIGEEGGGGTADLVDLTATSNGTYTHSGHDGYDTVTVAVPQPSGNINITDTNSTNVSAYATAQVVDADLVAGNIKKDVNILGVTGTYEGGGGTTAEYAFNINTYTSGGSTKYSVNILGDFSSNSDFYFRFGDSGSNGDRSVFPVMLGKITFPQNAVFVDDTIPRHFVENYMYLEEIENLPTGYTTIGQRAFMYAGVNCGSALAANLVTTMKQVISNNSVTEIGALAFAYVPSLGNIVIGSNVNTILANAFQGNNHITKVYFKGTPSSIYGTAFNNAGITDIYVPWSEGAVASAPWGAINATIHYDHTYVDGEENN